MRGGQDNPGTLAGKGHPEAPGSLGRALEGLGLGQKQEGRGSGAGESGARPVSPRHTGLPEVALPPAPTRCGLLLFIIYAYDRNYQQ